MPLKDSPTGYGWLSIALHWITAVIIVVLLFIGNSVGSYEGEERQQALDLHVSIAVTSYLFLWARIVWRFVYGHPGPLGEQRGVAFWIGKWTHLTILAALAVMLLSGPMIVWASGNDIVVFDRLVIPSPFEQNFPLMTLMHSVHAWSAFIVFMGILLHLGGVYKHTAFNQDGTLTKILISRAADPAQSETAEAAAAEAAGAAPAEAAADEAATGEASGAGRERL